MGYKVKRYGKIEIRDGHPHIEGWEFKHDSTGHPTYLWVTQTEEGVMWELK